MMRHRLEDLGRLQVLLRQLFEHDLFDRIHGRNKDFSENFYTLPETQQHDLLHDLAYGISHVNEKIAEALSIAEGDDFLNDRDYPTAV